MMIMLVDASGEKQKELYELYKESPMKCFKRCEEIGYSDKND